MWTFQAGQPTDLNRSAFCELLGLKHSTVNRKLLKRSLLSPDESERLMGLQRLIGQVEVVVRDCGDGGSPPRGPVGAPMTSAVMDLLVIQAVGIPTGCRWSTAPAALPCAAWKPWCTSAVPSVIVPEESNLLINPRHPACALLLATTVRRWTYDSRMQ